jgi:hypothetical protein
LPEELCKRGTTLMDHNIAPVSCLLFLLFNLFAFLLSHFGSLGCFGLVAALLFLFVRWCAFDSSPRSLGTRRSLSGNHKVDKLLKVNGARALHLLPILGIDRPHERAQAVKIVRMTTVLRPCFALDAPKHALAPRGLRLIMALILRRVRVDVTNEYRPPSQILCLFAFAHVKVTHLYLHLPAFQNVHVLIGVGNANHFCELMLQRRVHAQLGAVRLEFLLVYFTTTIRVQQIKN